MERDFGFDTRNDYAAKVLPEVLSDSSSESGGGKRRLTRSRFAGRSRLDAIILLTVLGWLIVTLSYLSWWMMTAESEYQGVWILPLTGFIIGRLPLSLIVLFVVVAIEMLFIREPERPNRSAF
jgi:hypothetical protein